MELKNPLTPNVAPECPAEGPLAESFARIVAMLEGVGIPVGDMQEMLRDVYLTGVHDALAIQRDGAPNADGTFTAFTTGELLAETQESSIVTAMHQMSEDQVQVAAQHAHDMEEDEEEDEGPMLVSTVAMRMPAKGTTYH